MLFVAGNPKGMCRFASVMVPVSAFYYAVNVILAVQFHNYVELLNF